MPMNTVMPPIGFRQEMERIPGENRKWYGKKAKNDEDSANNFKMVRGIVNFHD